MFDFDKLPKDCKSIEDLPDDALRELWVEANMIHNKYTALFAEYETLHLVMLRGNGQKIRGEIEKLNDVMFGSVRFELDSVSAEMLLSSTIFTLTHIYKSRIEKEVLERGLILGSDGGGDD
jgi:hypothetical protein